MNFVLKVQCVVLGMKAKKKEMRKICYFVLGWLFIH